MIIKKLKYNLQILTVIFIPLFSLSIQAQSANEAFSSITFRFSGSINSNRNTFHSYWTPIGGGELNISMPFYWGEIQAGSHLYGYDNKFDDMPDFLSNFIFIGWGFNLSPYKNLNWFNSIRTGTYQMYFDDEDIHETQRTESELGWELYSRLALNINSKWSLHMATSYLRVFTYKRLEFFMLSAGFGYSFNTPSWLKDFFE
jgi:hypothetical protein